MVSFVHEKAAATDGENRTHDTVMWGDARRWDQSRLRRPSVLPRPSVDPVRHPVHQSHGLGLSRADRLYYIVGAIEWSLRAANVRPLEPPVLRYLENMALGHGRIGWEAAIRALHKLHKRAWDWDDRLDTRLLNSSGFLRRCLDDSWRDVDNARHEQEQIANTTSINGPSIFLTVGFLLLYLDIVRARSNSNILRTRSSSPSASLTSPLARPSTPRPSTPTLARLSWRSGSGRARTPIARE